MSCMTKLQGTVDDKAFELYPPKKGKKGYGDQESREDEDEALNCKDGRVDCEDVSHLQFSD